MMKSRRRLVKLLEKYVKAMDNDCGIIRRNNEKNLWGSKVI